MTQKEVIVFLWQIIDNIDTIGDLAKDDNKLYRNLVEKEQLKRWKLPIKTDGYELDLSKIQSDWSMNISSEKI